MEHECYTLACSDTGIQCNYVAKGHTMDEMWEDALDHTTKVHNISEISDEEMETYKKVVKHHQEC
ncbi:MAG: DUF1059 domain-containing protein [Thermoplasmata archaeon]|nr:MAG: DUF1059 domain-containing protein [Thermoplasmata archaeon]